MMLSPEEEQSALYELGQVGLSSLGMLGNLFDLPGSTVRDLAAGENPLDQWLPWNWFSDEGRTSYTKGKSPGEGGFWGGLGLEIAMDPLTYLTGGASALTKAGKVAKVAGLLPEVQRALGRVLTKRQALAKATFGDVRPFASADQLASATSKANKLGFKSLDELKDVKLRGKVGVGIPFMDPLFTVGEGTLTGALGGKIGNALKLGPIGRHLGEMFKPSAMGVTDEAAQRITPLAYDTKRAQEDIASDMTLEFYEQTRNVPQADISNALEGITSPGPIARPVQQYRQAMAQDRIDAREYGQQFARLADPYADYASRGRNPLISALLKTNKGTMSSYSDARRGDIFKNVVGGSEEFNKFAKEAAGLNAVDIETLLKTKYLNSISDEFLRAKSGKITPGRHKALAEHLSEINALDDQALKDGYFTVHPTAMMEKKLRRGKGSRGVLKEVFDAFSDKPYMNSLLSQKGPKVAMSKVFKQMGLNLTDKKYTATEMFARTTGMSIDQAMLHVKREKWNTNSIARAVAKATGQTTDDVLEQISATTKGALPKFIQSLNKQRPAGAKLIKQDANSLKSAANFQVPKDYADSLVRMYKGDRAGVQGKVGQLVDKITDTWKFGMLAWPSFLMRNLFSGQMRNVIMGLFNPRDTMDALRLIRGKPLKQWQKYAKLPHIQRMLAQRGLQESPETVSRMVAQSAFAKRVSGTHMGEAASMRQAGARSLKDFQRAIPGEVQFQPTAAFRKSRNPDKTFKYWKGNPLKGTAKSTIGMGAEDATNIHARLFQDMNYGVESLNRLAPYLTQLKRGIDPGQAAKQVLAGQLDYQAMTKFQREKFLKLFPFGRFFMRNTPFIAKQLFEKPGGAIGQLYRGMNALQGQEGPLPQHVANTLSIPLGQLPDGSQRYFTGAGLMEEDPLGFVGGPQAVGIELLSRMNPLVKAPLEWAMGESTFQTGAKGGRDLDAMDPTFTRTAMNISQMFGGDPVEGKLKPFGGGVGGLVEHILSNSPLAKLGVTARTATDPRKGAGASAINLLTGAKVTDVSPAAQDAVIRELASSLLGEIEGASNFQVTSISDEAIAALPPGEQANAIQLKLLMNSLARRAKERKQAAGAR